MGQSPEGSPRFPGCWQQPEGEVILDPEQVDENPIGLITHKARGGKRLPGDLITFSTCDYCRRPKFLCQSFIGRPALRQAAKPGELALGPLPAAELNAADCLVQGDRGAEVIGHLSEPRGLRGLAAAWLWQSSRSVHFRN